MTRPTIHLTVCPTCAGPMTEQRTKHPDDLFARVSMVCPACDPRNTPPTPTAAPTAAPTVAPETVLAEAARLIKGDRARTHGDATAQHTALGRIWGAMLGLPDLPASTVMAMMVGLKLSRLAHGTPTRDHYVDGCGYLSLAWDAAENGQ